MSYNTETGELSYQPVEEKFTRFADDIYSLKIEGEKKPLNVTSEHPFFVRVHGPRSNLSPDGSEPGEWREVKNLKVGNEIRLSSGKWAKVLETKFKGKGQVYNFSVAENHNYFVGDSRLLTHNADCGRRGAFNAAKRDTNIPRGQQPSEVNRIPMTDRNGKSILDSSGKPIITREYTFTNNNGNKIVIQDHSAGHNFGRSDGLGNQGPHFNVRPTTNTRTGSVPGTQDHYPF